MLFGLRPRALVAPPRRYATSAASGLLLCPRIVSPAPSPPGALAGPRRHVWRAATIAASSGCAQAAPHRSVPLVAALHVKPAGPIRQPEGHAMHAAILNCQRKQQRLRGIGKTATLQQNAAQKRHSADQCPLMPKGHTSGSGCWLSALAPKERVLTTDKGPSEVRNEPLPLGRRLPCGLRHAMGGARCVATARAP